MLALVENCNLLILYLCTSLIVKKISKNKILIMIKKLV